MNAAQSARSIKKRRAPEKAADCLQYERMYESGICEVEPGLFSMTMAFTDVNFQLARQEEQKSLFTQYSEFLNYFDPDTHLQISLVTRRVDEAEFRRDTFLPLRGDSRDRYSEEMNRVISEKALQGQNGRSGKSTLPLVCMRMITEKRRFDSSNAPRTSKTCSSAWAALYAGSPVSSA